MKIERLVPLAASLSLLMCLSFHTDCRAQMVWQGLGANAQHSGISSVAAQHLDQIMWQMPVDLAPQYNGNDLFIHYGSPVITRADTVIVPVKTGANDGFRVEARNGANGAVKWLETSDFILPPHGWTPSFGPALTPAGRLYLPGAGGTVLFRDNVDSNGAVPLQRLAFFGLGAYNANSNAYNANVFINTPITSDSSGNAYFGVQVTNPGSVGGLNGGVVRIDPNGNATYVSAATASGDNGMKKLVHNSAPALSPDGKTLYVAVNNLIGTGFGSGYLLALNSTDLSTKNIVALKDVKNPGNNAYLPDDGTASPTVGPDGDVYFGVLENPFQTSKGWLLHFDKSLAPRGFSGAFGWDDTAALVPSTVVASYQGSSPYLLFSKYNNYAGLGGDGINKIAILDPFNSMVDPRSGATVMNEVEAIAGVTPDADFPGLPNAVREWCINSGVVDPFTDAIFANSEDGKLYRWDLATNSFTEKITLTAGVGEAYTPTLIGANGFVYAINNATLFAIGGSSSAPEPGAIALFLGAGTACAIFVVNPRNRHRR